MSLSFTEVEYLGGPQVFPTNFALGILEVDHIIVTSLTEVDGLGDPLVYEFSYNVSNADVTVLDTLAINERIRIARVVPKEELYVNFETSDITPRNVDNTVKQALMAVHEVVDQEQTNREIAQAASEIAQAASDKVDAFEDEVDDILAIAAANADTATTQASIATTQANNAANSAAASEAARIAAESSADAAATSEQNTETLNLQTQGARNIATAAANNAENDAEAAETSRIAAEAARDTAVANANATDADRVQTGLDRVATGEDRVQTGIDRVAAAASADAASGFAEDAAASAASAASTVISDDPDFTVAPASLADRETIAEYVVGRDLQGGTVVATTSGTAFDFTSIPAGVQEIDVIFAGVRLSGTDSLLVQLGGSTGPRTVGYAGSRSVSTIGGDGGQVSSTSGFPYRRFSGTNAATGIMTLKRVSPGSNTWVSTHTGTDGNSDCVFGGGAINLGAELDRVRVTRTGSNAFVAGQLNVRWK
jgi:hypothetical protein